MCDHIKHWDCGEDAAWNPSACACECDKDCEISEYLKDCKCMKSLVGDLVAMCDEVEHTVEDLSYVTPETKSINSNDKMNCSLIPVILLAIACLLFLVVIVFEYYVKHKKNNSTVQIPLTFHACDYHISINMNSAIEIDMKNCYFLIDIINIINLDPNKIRID